MKIIAAVIADCQTSPLGLPARLLENIGGKPILARLLQRLQDCGLFDSIFIVANSADTGKIRNAVLPLSPKFYVYDGPDVANRELLRRARKWAPESWRGALADCHVFYEEGAVSPLTELLRKEKADYLVKVSGSSPFFDPGLLKLMLEEQEGRKNNVGFFLSPAPPGFNFELMYEGRATNDMAAGNIPHHSLLRYNPDEVKRDIYFIMFMLQLDTWLTERPCRLMADSRRGIARLKLLHEAVGDSLWNFDLRETLLAIEANPHVLWDAYPRELEVEITNENNMQNILRPSVTDQREKRRMTLDEFKKIIDDAAPAEDIRLSLAGFGEPLLHPDIWEMLAYAKSSKIFGIHLHTNGLLLNEAAFSKLLELDIDVLSVSMDANSVDTWKKITGRDDFDDHVARVQSASSREQQMGRFTPFIVTEFIKARENLDDMEGYFDRWFQLLPMAAIKGHNHRAGQVEDRNVMPLIPLRRHLCDELKYRMMILSDGSVPYCAQDLYGKHIIASALKTSISDIWRGLKTESLRKDQLAGNYQSGPFCTPCRNWGNTL